LDGRGGGHVAIAVQIGVMRTRLNQIVIVYV
jgi:hypothetical protein